MMYSVIGMCVEYCRSREGTDHGSRKGLWVVVLELGFEGSVHEDVGERHPKQRELHLFRQEV